MNRVFWIQAYITGIQTPNSSCWGLNTVMNLNVSYLQNHRLLCSRKCHYSFLHNCEFLTFTVESKKKHKVLLIAFWYQNLKFPTQFLLSINSHTFRFLIFFSSRKRMSIVFYSVIWPQHNFFFENVIYLLSSVNLLRFAYTTVNDSLSFFAYFRIQWTERDKNNPMKGN